LNKIKRQDILNIILFIVAFIVTAIFILPILWQYLGAFKPSNKVISLPPVFFFKLSVDNFIELQLQKQALSHLKNSLIIVSVSTFVCLVLSIMAGYALARINFKGVKRIGFLMLVLTMVPTITLLIPLYDIMSKIGLLGTHAAIILVYIIFILPFNIWLMMGFFKGIPIEIEEAALIDGCNNFRVLFRVVVPISKPGIFATMIFSIMMSWGDFVFAGILGSKSSYTLAVIGATIEGKFGSSWGQLASLTLILTVPMVIFTMFTQKYLVEGLTFGAVKG
jgi:multiple sugar transport system permease protein